MKRFLALSILTMFIAGCVATSVKPIKETYMFVTEDNVGIYKKDSKFSELLENVNYADSVLITGNTWMFYQVKLDTSFGFIDKSVVMPRHEFIEYRIKQDYVHAALSFPLTFRMKLEDEKNAWGRAQSFIGRFSSMKLQIATEYVLQTYNPVAPDVNFGYYITKTPIENELEFNVQCITGNIFALGEARTNERYLAYYISTGKLYPEYVNK